MSAERVGIAIEAAVVRGVVRQRRRFVTAEVPWDPARPEEAVQQLRTQLGDVRGVSLAIGLAYLAIAKPELPPVDSDRARRVLLRDPDRYFPLDGRMAIASGGAGHHAFATSGDRLEAWVRAFSDWAPVRAVHAAPTVIVEALAKRQASSLPARQSFTVDADRGERGLVSMAGGRLHEVRRLPEAMAAATMNGARPLGDKVLDGIDGRFAAAVGALDAADAPLDGMLLDWPLEHALRRQRDLRLWRSVGLFVASLIVLAWAADLQRERLLSATQLRIQSLEATATPAYQAQSRLSRANAELQQLSGEGAQTSDALSVLAIVSRAMPASAFVQRLEWDGTEWRVDGSTDKAADIVPRLDAVPQLGNVHALGASTRFRDGARMRESFSVSFQVKEGNRATR